MLAACELLAVCRGYIGISAFVQDTRQSLFKYLHMCMTLDNLYSYARGGVLTDIVVHPPFGDKVIIAGVSVNVVEYEKLLMCSHTKYQ